MQIEMLKAHGTDLLRAVDLSGKPKLCDSGSADPENVNLLRNSPN